MERSTSQKRAILVYLKSTTAHPTAQQVYAHVRTTEPKISKATVYRNLDAFVRSGIISEIVTDTERRFDACIEDHAHFCCESCGRVSDIDVPMAQHKDLSAIAQCERVRRYVAYAYGVCSLCVHR